MSLSTVQKQRKLFFHEKSILWLLLEEGLVIRMLKGTLVLLPRSDS